jgi:hypothetical protein
MQVKHKTCLELLRSLLAPLQSLPKGGSTSEQLILLENAKQNLYQRLPIGISNHGQQQAVNILNLKACMELFCKRRIEKIRASSLAEVRKTELINALKQRLSNALQELEAQWPSLETHEEVILPLLLLRQNVEAEINFLIAKVREQAQAHLQNTKYLG